MLGNQNFQQQTLNNKIEENIMDDYLQADVEAEMKRLRIELKQTMDMYASACKEALNAKLKANELSQKKIEESRRCEEDRSAEKAALAVAKMEKAKCKAAVEAEMKRLEKEATDAKANELNQWKMEEARRLDEARIAEAALAVVEKEKAGCRAADEAPDFMEYPNAYVYMVDMPGIKVGEIKVQVEDENVLVVSGERKIKKEDVSMEMRIGKLTRIFQMRENSDLEKITAVCTDGFLKVTVPKLPPPEPKIPKTIQVQVLKLC